jgi:hypothetical protein
MIMQTLLDQNKKLEIGYIVLRSGKMTGGGPDSD